MSDRLVAVRSTMEAVQRSPGRVFSPAVKSSDDLYDALLLRSVGTCVRASTNKKRILDLTASQRILPRRNLLDAFHKTILCDDIVLPKEGSSVKEPERMAPSRILEVEGMEDDFYLNLLDWSRHNGRIAMGLGGRLVVWAPDDGIMREVARLPSNDIVASVGWQPSSSGAVAIGSKAGKLELINVEYGRVLRKFQGHCGHRTGTISWNGRNANVFSSGGRDKMILHHDVRCKEPTGRSNAHLQEICGLRWDPTGTRLASGGNDNKLFIWDGRSPESPLLTYDKHVAAVKALAWSPHTAGLLASGGGTADRTMRFWNTRGCLTESIKCVPVASQICNMAWSPHSNELVTTHGFSEHQVMRWSYPKLECTGMMLGHDQRVLHLATSPDGRQIVSGSADQTLRFWNCFKEGEKAGERDGRRRFREHGIATNPFFDM